MFSVLCTRTITKGAQGVRVLRVVVVCFGWQSGSVFGIPKAEDEQREEEKKEMDEWGKIQFFGG